MPPPTPPSRRGSKLPPPNIHPLATTLPFMIEESNGV